MKVSPVVVIRALITRLSPDERFALVGELLDGAHAAARRSPLNDVRLSPVTEEFPDACNQGRA